LDQAIVNRDINKELGKIVDVPIIPKGKFSRLRLEDIDNDLNNLTPQNSKAAKIERSIAMANTHPILGNKLAR
jgi:hypothetical protein